MSNTELITCQEVLRLTGIRSRSTIWRKMRKGGFPHPVDIGGARHLLADHQRVGCDPHFDLALANGFARPLAGFAVDGLQEQLGVAAGEHGFSDVVAVAMSHLTQRLEGGRAIHV